MILYWVAELLFWPGGSTFKKSENPCYSQHSTQSGFRQWMIFVIDLATLVTAFCSHDFWQHIKVARMWSRL